MARRSAKAATKQAPAEEEEEEVYEMEDIVGYDLASDGGEKFLVKWKGYPSSENTWEPSEHIMSPSSKMAAKMAAFRSSRNKETKRRDSGVHGSRSAAGKKVHRKKSKAAPEPEPEPEEEEEEEEEEEAAPPPPVPPKPADARGTKRKPPQDLEHAAAGSSRAAPPAAPPRGPEGSVRVHHMGRAPTEASSEYSVTLKWENGFQCTKSVSYVRHEYPDALMDYLLSRVRFRV